MRPITTYTDYRKCFRAWVRALPGRRSQRAIAKRLDVSPATVSMIVNGKRALSPDDAPAWGRAMRLAGEDLVHWVAMVKAAHGSDDERREAAVELRARRAFAAARRAPLQRDVFARWYTFAILELARCEGFVADPAAVAARLLPSIDPDAARAALEALTEVGLLVLAPDGRATAADTPLVPELTAVDRHAERLKQIHRQHLARATDALDDPPADRHFVTVMAAVPEHAVATLAARLERAMLSGLEAVREGEPHRVVEIGVQIVRRS